MKKCRIKKLAWKYEPRRHTIGRGGTMTHNVTCHLLGIGALLMCYIPPYAYVWGAFPVYSSQRKAIGAAVVQYMNTAYVAARIGNAMGWVVLHGSIAVG